MKKSSKSLNVKSRNQKITNGDLITFEKDLKIPLKAMNETVKGPNKQAVLNKDTSLQVQSH